MKGETMNVLEVVQYVAGRGYNDTALFFMKASSNANVCDTDGNMNADFIRKALSLGTDDIMFRELQCKVTTRVPFKK